MTVPGPLAASRLLHVVLTIESPPKRAREILAEIALSQSWAESMPVALEFAEQWEMKFIERLQRDYSTLVRMGRTCLFAINTSSEYMIQGAAFVEDGVDSEVVREIKRRYSFIGEYSAAIVSITATQFEWLCRGILTELGVLDAKVTPHSRDEGIDFYGRLKLENLLNGEVVLPGIEARLNVWMIGQAKHYQAQQVATPDIRELVGAVTLARAKAFGSSSQTKYADLDIAACDPVFFLFFTTGQISSDGWRLLEASGVIGMDGGMVAAFLARRQIALNADGEFEGALLTEWIESLKPIRT